MVEQESNRNVADRDGGTKPGPMLSADGNTLVTFDHAGRVSSTILCVACGYNLRGLLPTGVCTECGQPVVDALRSPLTRSAAARLRQAASVLVGTLPWLWLPLTWPVAFAAYWKLTARDAGARTGHTLIVMARYGLFVTMLAAWGLLINAGHAVISLAIQATIVLLMLFSAFVVLRLNARYGTAPLRRLGRFLGYAIIVAMLAAVVLVVAAANSTDVAIQVLLGLLALAAVLASLVAWLIALVGLWRTMEVLEIQAQFGGRLHQLRALVRQERAAASTQPDASASATSSA